MGDQVYCEGAKFSSWGLSRDDENNLLDLFATGWADLANAFRTGTRIAKRYEPRKRVLVDTELMKTVANARKHAVDALFRCASGPGTQRCMQTFGSDNVTSDYDVSILGPGACDVCWQMFVQFVRMYGALAPNACDTNLYANGTYLASPEDRAPAPEGVATLGLRDEARKFTYVPDNNNPHAQDEYVRACMAWAAAKSLMGDVDEASVRGVLGDEVVDDALARLDAAEAILAAAREPIARAIERGAFGSSWRPRADEVEADMDTIAKYALQTVFGRRMERAIYSAEPQGVGMDAEAARVLGEVAEAIAGTTWLADDEVSFADILCATMFFSVEAAFTQSAVNVVVLEIQGKRVSALPESDYRCALLENFGELMVHSRGAPGDAFDAAAALKLSKYVYRMAYSASKASDDADFASAMSAVVDTIKTSVLDLRGNTMPGSQAPSATALSLVCLDPGADRAAYRAAAENMFTSLWENQVPDRWRVPAEEEWEQDMKGGATDRPGPLASVAITATAMTMVFVMCLMGR